jgi:hypothetical protein
MINIVVARLLGLLTRPVLPAESARRRILQAAMLRRPGDAEADPGGHDELALPLG